MSARAQCPEFYDTFGNPSSFPYWISCSGDDFTLEILSDDAYGPYTIDWGDGNSDSGAGYTPGGNNPSHTYAATIDTMVVTITIPGAGCTITGVVVMEELVSAAIQIPNGGITKACAPQLMEFLNASTNVSGTTIFTWDFGDGSPNEVYDETNLNQTVPHVYQKGTVDCGTRVTLLAENYCSFGRPSVNTYEPILIWDIDDAAIDASATFLCYPDTVVTFRNTTERNCVGPAEGNFAQRYEHWRFIDYFGPGLDSVIDWRPWPPSAPITIPYPGKGTYQVELLDSNQCGIDGAMITINIVDPPTALLTLSEDTVCTGQLFTVTNNSYDGANEFFWRVKGVTNWMAYDGLPFDYSFNTQGTYEIELVANIADGTVSCTDTVSEFIVVLPGPESSFNITPKVGCDTVDVAITNTTLVGVTWFWDYGNGQTYNQRDPVNPINYQGAGVYPVSLTVTSANNCSSVLYDTVRVFESPEADFIAANACIGSPVSFIDQSTHGNGDPIIDWDWDFGDGNGSNAQHPIHNYAVDASYNVSLQVNTANCTSSIVKPITLHPVPSAIIFAPDTSGCTPLQIAFQNFSTVSNSYRWDFGDGSPIDTSVAPTHTFVNNSTTNQVFTVRLIAETNEGCADTSYQQILVYPPATGTFTHNGTPDCGPMLVQFVNTSSGGTNYAWDFGDGSPISNAPNPAHLYQNKTAFIEIFQASLIVTSARGCTDTISQPITVYPEPDFDFTMTPDEGCTPLSVDFNVITNGNYQWDFDDGTSSTLQSPTHVFSHNNLFNTTYRVQLIGTSSFGCTDTVEKNVVVKPNPVADFDIDIDEGCGPLTINFTNQSNMASSFQWNYGDGNTSTTSQTNHTYTFVNLSSEDIERVITLTAIANNGCTAEFKDTITVFGKPIAAFDEPPAQCHPSLVNFVNRSQFASSYQWNFADGSPIENGVTPSHQFNNISDTNLTYLVSLEAISANGCSDTTIQPVLVYPLPGTSFNSSPIEGCHPLTVTLNNTTSGAQAYNWSYGNGAGSTNANAMHNIVLTNQTPSPLDYEVELTASSAFGCSSKHTEMVRVYPEVVAAIAPVSPGCAPYEVFFNNESVNASTYAWDFDDGNTNLLDKHPSHIFLNNSGADRIFNVALIATSSFGCVDTAFIPLQVYASPIAAFDVDNDVGCHEFEITLTNNSIGASTYLWDFDDGTQHGNTATNFTHIYTNASDSPIDRTIQLIASTNQGCTDTLEKEINVLPRIVADFDVPPPACTPYEVNMFNKSLGASQYEWTYPGGISFSANPDFVLENIGVDDEYQRITLMAQSKYGCIDSVSKEVLVYARPQPDFDVNPVEQTYPDAEVTVANLTPGNNWSYQWKFGDGFRSFSEDPSPHRYSTWGNYRITLIATGTSCSDSISQQIVINPAEPQANFQSGPNEGCVAHTVQFTNQSLYAETYFWSFGDGNHSELPNPTHTYSSPGTYTVSLVVSGPGGTDEEIKQSLIRVYAYAEAFFTLSPQNPQEVYKDREPVDFFNFSQNADRYLWNFGDGQFSEDENPSHYYNNIGVFDVQLIANNENNCPDTFAIEAAVRVVAGGRLQMPNAFTPNPNGSNGGVTNGDVLSNDVFFPLFDQVDKFHMQIFNRWGELIFETRDIHIGWDGYFNGELCPQDVYVYKAEVVYPGGETDVLVGDVTLLR